MRDTIFGAFCDHTLYSPSPEGQRRIFHFPSPLLLSLPTRPFPHFPTLPSPLFPSSSLRRTPLKSSYGPGERCKLPQRVRVEPDRQTIFSAFCDENASGGSHFICTFTRNMFFFSLFTSNNARSRNMRPLSILEPPPPTGRYGDLSTGSACEASAVTI